MIKLIDIDSADIWDNTIKLFSAYDIYYLNGYVKAFQIHGDGIP